MRRYKRFGVKKEENKKTIEAVLDTNIFISGLFAQSGSIAILMKLWTEGGFNLITSEDILSELYRTLHKPTIQKHFNPSKKIITEYLETIREKAVITPGFYQTDQIKNDPSDNKFLSCAVEGKADYIVSGDKHLKEVKQFHGIQIVNAKEFVERVKRK